jgi:hypothetical protein
MAAISGSEDDEKDLGRGMLLSLVFAVSTSIEQRLRIGFASNSEERLIPDG